MTKDEISELLTLEEAARILKVHPGTLRRWDKDNILKAIRVGIRRNVGDRRYKIEDVKNYIKQKEQKKKKK